MYYKRHYWLLQNKWSKKEKNIYIISSLSLYLQKHRTVFINTLIKCRCLFITRPCLYIPCINSLLTFSATYFRVRLLLFMLWCHIHIFRLVLLILLIYLHLYLIKLIRVYIIHYDRRKKILLYKFTSFTLRHTACYLLLRATTLLITTIAFNLSIIISWEH